MQQNNNRKFYGYTCRKLYYIYIYESIKLYLLQSYIKEVFDYIY